ncbi:MAG: gamma-glutamyltransferase [Bacteroidia bacterium]|nr:gamma-glutamyltransferase [Bacteroidia bacterium]
MRTAKQISVSEAAVVSAHPEASLIGADILRRGGNAIDAAIAVQFALAVCYPVAGNIGGGGFMVARMNDGDVFALDFRETAPAAAHRDMYLDSIGNPVRDLSLKGHLAVGVPGTVDGMIRSFEKLSKLKDWKLLVEPSVRLAKEGFQITDKQARRLNKYSKNIKELNNEVSAYTTDHTWKKGDLLIQEDLSRVLETIRDNKREGFYSSWVADSLVNEMKVNGGLISYEDLRDYKSVWREEIRCNYRGYEIISMSPPSSGGIILCQLLQMVEDFDLNKMGFHSPDHIHLFAECERRAYADRSKHLGDSDFYPVPQEQLLDSSYNRSRISNFDPEKTTPSNSVSWGGIKESEETTHFSIIDQEGNVVSLTTTLNTAYGSKVLVDGAGFFLNNEMDDFSVKPGTPNYFGMVGQEANKIEANKRMLSSMTPTIVLKDNLPVIVTGTPGGSTIITSVFQTITNIIDFEMDAATATNACRFHHQWLPDQIYLEEDCLDSITIHTLKDIGHQTKVRSPIGKVETIVINPGGKIEAAGDRRGDDAASGF